MCDSSSSEDLFADMTGLGDAASDDEESNEDHEEVEAARMREAERAAMARWEAGQRAREQHAAITEATTSATAKLDLSKPSASPAEVTPTHREPTTSPLPETDLGIAAALSVQDTGRFACSAETCLAGAHSDAVAVGTYQLDEAAGRRDGNVQLYRVVGEEHSHFSARGDNHEPKDESGDCGSTSEEADRDDKANDEEDDFKRRTRLVPCGQLEMPSGGVLDCKWELVVSSGKSPRLACATANGSLVFLTLNEHWRREASISGSNGSSSGSSASDSGSIGSPFRFEGVSEPAGHLFLSLDWNNRSPLFHRALSPKVAVGEALGCVSMWHANSGSSMAEISGVGAGNADSSDGKDRCDSGSSGDSGSTIRSGYRGDGGNAEVGAPVLERRWLAHTLCGEPSEVWSVAFDPSAPHTLLASGADDACLKLWDLRAASGTSSSTSSTSSTSTSSTSNSSSTSSTDSSRRSSNGVFGCAPGLAACVAGAHNAGVTSLAFAPSERWPHVLASGSYDGTVRLWDLRMLTDVLPVSSSDSDGTTATTAASANALKSRRGPVASALAGGGCWRLKWRSDGALLVGAMHGGATVLRLVGGDDDDDNDDDSGWIAEDQKNSVTQGKESTNARPAVRTLRLQGVARYLGHGSMAYGADWCSSNAHSPVTPSQQESHAFGLAQQHSVAAAEPRLEDGRSSSEVVNARIGRSSGSTTRSNQDLCVTCSFYDHALHLWRSPI